MSMCTTILPQNQGWVSLLLSTCISFNVTFNVTSNVTFTSESEGERENRLPPLCEALLQLKQDWRPDSLVEDQVSSLSTYSFLHLQQL